MDSYKLVHCNFPVGQPDKPYLRNRIHQINVSNCCVFSHYPIGIMTKSFPVHITCGGILLVKNSDPDINSFMFGCLEFAGFI